MSAPVPISSSISASNQPDAETELAARAAWLHYAGGMTQGAVAERLGLTPTRTHRLISRAARDGLVRVFVDCDVAECMALEDALSERFGLTLCSVIPDLGDDPELPLLALSQGGSRFLLRVIESGQHTVVGVGHGRTLAAVVDALPRNAVRSQSVRSQADNAEPSRWVSLLGGLTRKFSANPYDVIFRLAEKSGGEAYFMPAPMYADTVEDRAVMLGQTGLREIMRHIDNASLFFLGIGATEASYTLALGTMADGTDVQTELRESGAVAELLGQFLDAEGKLVSTRWDGRMMAPMLDTLGGRDVVAVAGGSNKVAAIGAALGSGYLTGLITDESSARALAETSR